MLKIIVALLVNVQPMTHLEVETFDGEVHIIGVGDTCADAWKNHGPIPENWRDIHCTTFEVAYLPR
jgi:hypothetical protein